MSRRIHQPGRYNSQLYRYIPDIGLQSIRTYRSRYTQSIYLYPAFNYNRTLKLNDNYSTGKDVKIECDDIDRRRRIGDTRIVRRRTSTQMTPEETRSSVTKGTPKPAQERRYGIGITGVDRLMHPFYSFAGKLVWAAFLLAFSIAAFYQSICCIIEYIYGAPAVSIEFESRSIFPLPKILICPREIFGRHPYTDELRRKYQEEFDVSPEEAKNLIFSDFLKLRGVNTTTLWDIYHLTPNRVEVSYNCLASGSDRDCISGIILEEQRLSSGSCLALIIENDAKIVGPVTSLDFILKKPENEKWNWMMFDVYARLLEMSKEENHLFTEVEAGHLLPFPLKAAVLGEGIQLRNLNLPDYPCEDSASVERCSDKCLEDKLYHTLPCRLPYMNNQNYTLKQCVKPEEFNQSMELNKDILGLKEKCKQNCSRKCEEFIFVVFGEFVEFGFPYLMMSVRMFDTVVIILQEYRWYLGSYLIADIGGSFGFFLDLTVLTLVEILEVLLEVSKVALINLRKKKNVSTEQEKEKTKSFSFGFRITRRNRNLHKQMMDSSGSADYDSINIGIIGCDRLFSKDCSTQRKVMWFFFLVVSSATCAYQIRDAILNYNYGDPDVTMKFERNSTLTYPSITICPLLPFNHWSYFEEKRFEYAYEFNITGRLEDILLSDLAKLPNWNISQLWNETGLGENEVKKIDNNCNAFSQMEKEREILKITYKEVMTIHGKCFNAHIETQARFRGSSTKVCISMDLKEGISNLPEVISIFLHSSEDDPRTVDQHLGIPFSIGTLAASTLLVKKLERLNTVKNPCVDRLEASKCRSECFDYLMERNATCRLPFMRNSSLEMCETPKSFNHTMGLAFALYKNTTHNWCNCPRKCVEYLYGANSDGMKLKPSLPILVIALLFPNNIIKVTTEYNQMTLNTLFANICGSLGLFLGFTALTVLEIIESILMVIIRKSKAKH